MFESDDFDQILSQLDFPEPCPITTTARIEKDTSQNVAKCGPSRCTINKFNPKFSKGVNENLVENAITKGPDKTTLQIFEENNQTSLKHSKRKLINSYFDHKNKRKFPGPAGLLNGTFEDAKKVDDICHVELLSQDVDYSETFLRKGIFESPLWARLLHDTKGINKVESIKDIKQQALNGNLRCQKAEVITAYVEKVDRSAIDPLIVLRDMTDDIKCTLHRDAWVAFSPYIVSECCALVLCSPTVLTTGSAFKKHYLNITLSNIHAVYSSAIIKQEEALFPTGFTKVYEDDYTVIQNVQKIIGIHRSATEFEDSHLLDGLHGAFLDDVFL